MTPKQLAEHVLNVLKIYDERLSFKAMCVKAKIPVEWQHPVVMILCADHRWVSEWAKKEIEA